MQNHAHALLTRVYHMLLAHAPAASCFTVPVTENAMLCKMVRNLWLREALHVWNLPRWSNLFAVRETNALHNLDTQASLSTKTIKLLLNTS